MSAVGCIRSAVRCSRTQATVAQSSAEAELYALTSAANDLIHLQSVIMELDISKSVEGIKLHLHTVSASGKAMVSKLGMSKKSKHIELRYLHLQGLVESGVITVHKIGTFNNPSDIFTKFMPQASLIRHVSKVGIAEVGIDEVSIHHLRVKLNVNALSSSSTADIDVRTPKSRKKCKDDSVGVS
eukprot:174222-Amphidinium_carterae.1